MSNDLVRVEVGGYVHHVSPKVSKKIRRLLEASNGPRPDEIWMDEEGDLFFVDRTSGEYVHGYWLTIGLRLRSTLPTRSQTTRSFLVRLVQQNVTLHND